MKQFLTMCQTIGGKVDYVQGGGGNASYKYGENKMSIKASGFTIGEITETEGYVDVDYIKIKEYHTDVNEQDTAQREKESTPFTLSCVFPKENGKSLRPSVETGFHSFLKKYVMHTHPVYANVVTCAVDGYALAKKILSHLDFVWIPYINPGFSLTLAIKDAIKNYENETRHYPQVILLQNHGVITTADDAEECTRLHVDVNDTIKSYLKLHDFYDGLSLTEDKDCFICNAPFIGEFLAQFGISKIEEIILYPDQLVYLNAGIKEGKLSYQDDCAVIKTVKKEALAILETFAAFAYVITEQMAVGLHVNSMDEAGRDFIKNWESEKYRKAVAEKK